MSYGLPQAWLLDSPIPLKHILCILVLVHFEVILRINIGNCLCLYSMVHYFHNIFTFILLDDSILEKILAMLSLTVHLIFFHYSLAIELLISI